VVFYYSLKDERPTAPKKSCGSGAGLNWPTAHKVLIRATQPDIALRCCRVPLAVRMAVSEEIQKIARYRIQGCVSTRELSRLFAQEM